MSGDYGKPRPAVVVQSDWLPGTDSVLVCLVTSAIREAPLFRFTLEPDASHGLRVRSQVMVDKIVAARRDKCGEVIGRLGDAEVLTLNRMLALALGIAD